MVGTKLAIFGSCVTRDLFDLGLEDVSEYVLPLYLSRATALSVISSQLSEELIALENMQITGFDDRRFVNDLRKEHIQLLKLNDWDVLLIDLIDERHATFVFGEAALTYTKSSRKYLDPLLEEGVGQLLSPLAEATVKATLHALDQIASKINEIRVGRPVFVHTAYYAKHYLSDGVLVSFSDEMLSKIDAWNIFLQKAYGVLCKYKGFIQIKVDEEFCIAGGEHKWDLTPYHYEKSYYVRLGKLLVKHLSETQSKMYESTRSLA